MRCQAHKGLIDPVKALRAAPIALIAMTTACVTSTPAPQATPDRATEATSAPAAARETSPELAIPDREIGLHTGSVFETQAPEVWTPTQADPGELPLLPRAYEEAPPRVPHNVADLLPITPSDNLCLDCHAISAEDATEGDPTPMPQSHFTDLRAEGEIGSEVIGARWICVSCHVASSDAELLVENGFAR